MSLFGIAADSLAVELILCIKPIPQKLLMLPESTTQSIFLAPRHHCFPNKLILLRSLSMLTHLLLQIKIELHH